MNNIIDFEEARRRPEGASENPIVQALDALALALTEHDHEWSEREVMLYETAISYCGCTDFGS